MKPLEIAVDFDGTIVEHDYPRIGQAVPLAIGTLHELQAAGHKLILWTMRSGPYLEAAVNYCRNLGIEFYGVNRNPTQDSWTDSPKAYAQLYIDDAAMGCPLIVPKDRRAYVDWRPIRRVLGLSEVH